MQSSTRKKKRKKKKKKKGKKKPKEIRKPIVEIRKDTEKDLSERENWEPNLEATSAKNFDFEKSQSGVVSSPAPSELLGFGLRRIKSEFQACSSPCIERRKALMSLKVPLQPRRLPQLDASPKNNQNAKKLKDDDLQKERDSVGSFKIQVNPVPLTKSARRVGNPLEFTKASSPKILKKRKKRKSMSGLSDREAMHCCTSRSEGDVRDERDEFAEKVMKGKSLRIEVEECRTFQDVTKWSPKGMKSVPVVKEGDTPPPRSRERVNKEIVEKATTPPEKKEEEVVVGQENDHVEEDNTEEEVAKDTGGSKKKNLLERNQTKSSGLVAVEFLSKSPVKKGRKKRLEEIINLQEKDEAETSPLNNLNEHEEDVLMSPKIPGEKTIMSSVGGLSPATVRSVQSLASSSFVSKSTTAPSSSNSSSSGIIGRLLSSIGERLKRRSSSTNTSFLELKERVKLSRVFTRVRNWATMAKKGHSVVRPGEKKKLYVRIYDGVKKMLKSQFFRTFWNICLVVVVLVNVTWLFFRSCFSLNRASFIPFDILLDLFYFFDILQNFISPNSNDNLPNYSVAMLRASSAMGNAGAGLLKKGGGYFLQLMKYIFHYNFAIDIVSAIPVDYICGFFFWNYYSVMRMNRTLKMLRFGRYFNQLQANLVQINKSALRLIYSIVMMLLLIHTVACVWFLFMTLQGPENCTFEFIPGGVDMFKDPVISQYFRSFYFSLITLTGYFNAQPKTNLELVFSGVFSAFGLVVYISIISSIGSLYNEIDVSTTFFQQKMDEVNEFLRVRKVGNEIGKNVRDYYTYMWKSRRTLNEERILEDLPVNLRVDILTNLNKKMIEKVPFFREKTTGGGSKVNTSFISLIVLKMKPQLAPPGSMIIRAGSIGRMMFFIAKGSVEILVGKEGRVVAVLESGNYFGEIAILLKNTKRTASVRAKDYTDLFTISKKDFIEVLERFPKQKKIVEIEAQKRKLAAALMTLNAAGGSNASAAVGSPSSNAKKK